MWVSPAGVAAAGCCNTLTGLYLGFQRFHAKWPVPPVCLTPAGFIRRLDGVIRTAIAQPHRGGHANHPFVTRPASDQFATRVRRDRRITPVATAFSPPRVGKVIGMATAMRLGMPSLNTGAIARRISRIWQFHLGAAGFKHRAVLAVDNLDAQTSLEPVKSIFRCGRNARSLGSIDR